MEIGFITFLAIILAQGILFSALFGNYLKKRNWKIAGPVQIWRSKKGFSLLNKLAREHPGFWKAFGSLGIILGFGFIGGLYVFRKRPWVYRIPLAALASSFLLFPVFPYTNQFTVPTFLFGYGPTLAAFAISTGASIITGLAGGQPVVAKAGPIVPGIDIKGSPFKGVPWYGWLAIPILLIVHEMSHGVLARIGKIKLNSTGVILMGLLPLGAFVEPDEKQLEKAPPDKTLPLFGAGSSANFVTAVVIYMFLVLAVSPVLSITGISAEIQKYRSNLLVVASQNPDVPVGVELIAINGMPVKTEDDVHNITRSLKPNSTIVLTTDHGEIQTHLMGNIIGVYLTYSLKDLPLHLEAVNFIIELLGLIAFFNMVVGVMNLLPMLPLDGGLILRDFLTKVLKLKHGNALTIAISAIVGLALLANLLPLVLMGF